MCKGLKPVDNSRGRTRPAVDTLLFKEGAAICGDQEEAGLPPLNARIIEGPLSAVGTYDLCLTWSQLFPFRY